jgi:hypothetical protein
MKQTFREWLRRKEEDNKINELKEENARVWHMFESFDSHFEIQKIYRNESVNISFYNFKIRNFNYRIFIEQREDKIHIGFEKEDEFFMNKWKIDGIDDELKNGEIQKLFGTIIYVINELYKQEFNHIKIQTNEEKKFRVYLRLVQQISKKLLPDSNISHNDKEIFIVKSTSKETSKNIDTIFKYKPKK